jgi:simple sugar transport system permease protein
MIRWFKKNKLQVGVFGVLVFFWLLFMAFSPKTFLSFRIYISFMSTIPFTAMLALGLTYLVIAGELDLSFPSVMALSGFVFAFCFTATGNGPIAFGAGILTGCAAGFINGLIVVKIGVPSIIATIGMQFFWRGLTTVMASGLALNLVDLRGTFLHRVGVGRLFDMIPAQAFWCLALAALAWLILNYHIFGDTVLFIGDDMKAAKMSGINIDATRMGLFVLMGFISALVSILICLEMANWWPTQGEGYLLIVFASIFIGGTSVFGGEGTVFGTVIGAVIIGILEAGIISMGLSGFWTRLVYGLTIVVSVSVYAVVFQQKRE